MEKKEMFVQQKYSTQREYRNIHANEIQQTLLLSIKQIKMQNTNIVKEMQLHKTKSHAQDFSSFFFISRKRNTNGLEIQCLPRVHNSTGRQLTE